MANLPEQVGERLLRPFQIRRVGYQRLDPAWIADLLASGDVRVIPVWRDRCVVSGDQPVPVMLAGQAARALMSRCDETVLLGLQDQEAIFAVDLSLFSEDEALRSAGAKRSVDVRELAGAISAAQAARLGYARGLLYWHRHQRYCGVCGSPTVSRDGGHARICLAAHCQQLHFPRIEPAVIVLVESADPPDRCLLARHRGAKQDSYSTLAGFVEVGESTGSPETSSPSLAAPTDVSLAAPIPSTGIC